MDDAGFFQWNLVVRTNVRGVIVAVVCDSVAACCLCV